MRPAIQAESFFIGWDVGGWNCEKTVRSRDALVILDADLVIVGRPWRGNLRECIVSSSTTRDWLCALFSKCGAEYPETHVQVALAIDTPLGFSEEFVGLVTRLRWSDPSGNSEENHYLFRQTERHLFHRGRRPLSAVKDMIGSQATKGMHVVAKFAPMVKTCGVWTNGHGLQVIETYPAACRDSRTVQQLLRRRKPLTPSDLNDALICALIARYFAVDPSTLEPPSDRVPPSEGWIWVPKSNNSGERYENLYNP